MKFVLEKEDKSVIEESVYQKYLTDQKGQRDDFSQFSNFCIKSIIGAS